jgi:hypothetical protein
MPGDALGAAALEDNPEQRTYDREQRILKGRAKR